MSGGNPKAMKQQNRAAKMAGPHAELREAYAAAVGVRTQVALSTQTAFAERPVHFWSDHFAVSVDKIMTLGLAGAFEFEAIRPHILGKLADLLGAAERHPAMLLHLDRAQSVGPGSPLGARAAQRSGARTAAATTRLVDVCAGFAAARLVGSGVADPRNGRRV